MLLKSTSLKWMGFIIAILVMVLFMCASVIYGYTDTSWQTAVDAFTNYNGSNEHIIIQTVRLAESVNRFRRRGKPSHCRVLMQTLTKNPLASPGIFGINAGGRVCRCRRDDCVFSK